MYSDEYLRAWLPLTRSVATLTRTVSIPAERPTSMTERLSADFPDSPRVEACTGHHREPVRASLLFVCTANRCRSPMAAALFRQSARQLGADIVVHSAGLLEAGAPPLPETLEEMSRRGIDLSGHRSRQVDKELIASSDLVVGLERLHVRAVVLASEGGEAWGRSFTLREVVRRGRELGARPVELSLAEWTAELHRPRRRSELLGSSPVDDIADPAGQGAVALRAAATVIADLVDELLGLLWPSGAS